MKASEQPGVSLQYRVQIDGYDVAGRGVDETEIAVHVSPDAPSVGKVPAALSRGFQVVVKGASFLLRQSLGQPIILPAGRANVYELDTRYN